MIAEITSGMVAFGHYDFSIRVTYDDGRIFHWSKSVLESEVNDENIEIWKQEAINESIIHWNNNNF